MIYFNNCYAKIWEIKCSEKYTDVRISTSEKNKDGEYVNSNWFGRCIGAGHNDILNFKEGDRVKITKGKVTNEVYTDKDGNKKSMVRVLIYGLEELDNNSYTPAQASTAPTAKPSKKNVEAEEPSTDEDYPF